ncbi:regucalcin-like [Lycorma delicatula]|uniref:regucalcin-like n=1 Tax=Lycorma delicatula TaxID=130591 RepID=UPI003F51235F
MKETFHLLESLLLPPSLSPSVSSILLFSTFVIIGQLVTQGICRQCLTHLAGGLTPTLIPVTLPVLHGEGPHWDAHIQVLYFVDISGKTVHRLNPSTNTHTSISLNDTVSFVIPLRGRVNQFIIGLGKSLAVLLWDGLGPDFELHVKESVDKDKHGNRFNDGKADPWGRLWAGTMGEENPVGSVKMNQGTLYHWSMTLCRLENKLSPVSISNGIAWSDDMKFMYYADTPTRQIDVFDYDGGEIKNRRIAFDFAENNVLGNPDGMTIDRQNYLWIACWGGYRVIQIDPQLKKLIKTILLPVERITSVTFGGPLLDILYVTTMKLGLNDMELRKQPLAGSTFAVTNLGSRDEKVKPVTLDQASRRDIVFCSSQLWLLNKT